MYTVYRSPCWHIPPPGERRCSLLFQRHPVSRLLLLPGPLPGLILTSHYPRMMEDLPRNWTGSGPRQPAPETLTRENCGRRVLGIFPGFSLSVMRPPSRGEGWRNPSGSMWNNELPDPSWRIGWSAKSTPKTRVIDRVQPHILIKWCYNVGSVS